MEPAFFKRIFRKLKEIIKEKTRKIRKINLRNFHVKISFLLARFVLKSE